MRHFTIPDYWNYYQELPNKIQYFADKNFKILKENPRHPSLQLKKVKMYWSVRGGDHYRALGVDEKSGQGILWFWIGSHAEYDKLIN